MKKLLICGFAIALNFSVNAQSWSGTTTTGSVGIGTTTPADKLQIVNGNVLVDQNFGLKWSGSAGFLTLTGSDNFILRIPDADVVTGVNKQFIIYGNNTEPYFRFTSGGYLGIGTTTIDAKLHVNGSVKLQGIGEAAGKVLTSDATGNATWTMPIWSQWVNSGSALTYSGGQVNVDYNNQSAGVYPLHISNGTSHGNLALFEKTTSGGIGGLKMYLSDADYDGKNDAFFTSTNSTNNENSGLGLVANGQVQFFLSKLGNIGIGGEVTPSEKLQISGGNLAMANGKYLSYLGNTGAILRSVNSNISNYSGADGGAGHQLEIIHISSNGGEFANRRGFLNITADAGALNLKSNQSVTMTTNGAQRMAIDVNGNVGIGTTTADAKLHVNGGVKLQGIGEAAGKVLTSDASGNATWQAPGAVTSDCGGAGQLDHLLPI